MSAPTSAKLQVNYKTPQGTLINVYADNASELDLLLDNLAERLAKVASIEGLVVAGATVARAGMVAPPAAQPAQPAATPPNVVPFPGNQGPAPDFMPQQPAAAPAGPACVHGARVHRTGTKQNGSSWSAWFCPAPKGAPDQCDPIWG